MYYQNEIRKRAKLVANWRVVDVHVRRCIVAACYFFVTPRDYRSLLLSRLYRKRQDERVDAAFYDCTRSRWYLSGFFKFDSSVRSINNGVPEATLSVIDSSLNNFKDTAWHSVSVLARCQDNARYQNRWRFSPSIIEQRLLTGNFKNSYSIDGLKKLSWLLVLRVSTTIYSLSSLENSIMCIRWWHSATIELRLYELYLFERNFT